MEDFSFFFLSLRHGYYINFLLPSNIARSLVTSNDTDLLSYNFCWLRVWAWVSSVLEAQDITRLKLKSWPGVRSYLRLIVFQAHDCCQNSFPCGCMTMVLCSCSQMGTTLSS